MEISRCRKFARGNGSCSTSAQQTQHLVEARIAQRQAAAALLGLEGDAQSEDPSELAFQRQGVGVARRVPGWPYLGAALDQPLGGADIEPAAHDLLGQRPRGRLLRRGFYRSVPNRNQRGMDRQTYPLFMFRSHLMP